MSSKSDALSRFKHPDQFVPSLSPAAFMLERIAVQGSG
jgi:hypothetical protein